jgi:arylsulfatase
VDARAEVAHADKPFFVYFAPGAVHAPHHVPKEWSDRYKGKFDDGWDKLRERILARQKKLGVVAKDAQLTRRHAEIPAWDDISEDLKPIVAREMEVYAGFLEHTDHHIGRVIDAIEKLGVLDNTLIIYILGDNGASAEGGIHGTFNENLSLNAMLNLETPDFLKARIDAFGSPEAYNHYAIGWAHAMDTPYQWTKQVASLWGGTRNGTIVRWPRGIKAAGEVRHQFAHVIDVAPTLLEAAGIPEPSLVHGVTQSPMEGTSMVYSFDDAGALERHDLQYFEMLGNRGIYFRGWSAITRHGTPWETGAEELPPFDDDVWELYDGSKDWTQSHDLAKEMPDKLHELQRLWLIEAARYNVLPLDERVAERAVPEMAGRPSLVQGRSQLLYAGMGRLPENAVLDVKNKSFTVTAAVDVPEEGAEGVVIAQGGQFGGWALQATHGKAKFIYNLFGLRTFEIEAKESLPPGRHELRSEFAYDGGGLAKGGTVSLYYDRTTVANGRVDQTIPFVFSLDETMDIGHDTGTPVSADHAPHDGAFTGTIEWVQIETGKIAADQEVPAEERVRIALVRQ